MLVETLEMEMIGPAQNANRRARKTHHAANDIRRRPFVGNECVDDNVAECVQLAIWKAAGLHVSAAIRIEVHGDTVRLSGELASNAERKAAEDAAHSVLGVTVVENCITVRGAL